MGAIVVLQRFIDSTQRGWSNSIELTLRAVIAVQIHDELQT